MEEILVKVFLLALTSGISAITTISTDPPYNPLATGFNNLIVTAQFPTPTDFGDSCGWYYGGELGSGNGNIYSTLGGCDPSPSNVDRSVTCIIDATDHIITTLTITQPLVAGNLDIDVRCTFATNTPVPINRTVKDCPSSLPHDVIISSSLGTYQDDATFSCPPGRELYYSNSTALQSSDTTCLANAEWSGQDNLQCWSAPDVTLNGDLNIVENNDITLTCDYDVTVIPSGTSSTFYFDNVGYTLNKADAFSRTLQREDNMKPISCQAITPYTEVNNSTGRSLTETVNVMYAASQVAIPTCNWNFNEAGICSVVFFSSPNSQFVSLKKNGSRVASDGSMTIESTGVQGQQSFTYNLEEVILGNSQESRRSLLKSQDDIGALWLNQALLTTEVTGWCDKLDAYTFTSGSWAT